MEYAFLDENNIVVEIGVLDIANVPADFAYPTAISIDAANPPSIGMRWDTETHTFV